MPALPAEDWLRVADVVAQIPLSDSTVRRLIASGELSSVKIGRSRLIRRADLDLLLTGASS